MSDAWRQAPMQYDPDQGQGQGHEPICMKVGKSAIFKGYLLSP